MIRPQCAGLLAMLVCLAWSGSASAAVTCEIDDDSDMDFGRPGFPIGPVRTTSTITVSCQGNAADAGKSALVCVGVNPDTTSPRTMGRNGSSRSQVLRYDIYGDSAFAQPLDFRNNISTIVTVGANGNQTRKVLTLHGRLTSPQAAPQAGNYRETVVGVWGWSTTATHCDAVPQASPDFTFIARATLFGSCSIAANDLNFGTHAGLTSAATASTTLSVSCTSATLYRISLNGGLGGSIANRRMRLNGTGAQTVAYNLYRDSAHSELWGDGTGGSSVVEGIGSGGAAQSIAVHGRVPAAANVAAGTYTDVVTATIEY